MVACKACWNYLVSINTFTLHSSSKLTRHRVPIFVDASFISHSHLWCVYQNNLNWFGCMNSEKVAAHWSEKSLVISTFYEIHYCICLCGLIEQFWVLRMRLREHRFVCFNKSTCLRLQNEWRLFMYDLSVQM